MTDRSGMTIDRRTLLRAGGLGLGLASSSPLLAQAGERGFTHGVASGEPGADSVLLWTRHVGMQDHALTCEVSENDDFAAPAWSGTVSASPERDWCAKAVADGLEPGRWYYYRFISPDGVYSDLGRTRTLPKGPTTRWRMAVFSCSNKGFGWFNGYAHAAEDGAFDCTLHLGDYLYEYPPGTYPDGEDIVAGRAIAPDAETVALADYRARYASYRSDPDLQRIHQLYPMIAGWDDHESTNDSWEGGAQNHQPDSEGPWSARKAAAVRAYREWMPVSDADYATYQVGDLATLFRLETRLGARSQQFDLGAIRRSASDPDSIMAALTAFRDGEYLDPARTVLGATQEAWLTEGLRASTRAGTTWQVLVQQVLMGRLSAPSQLLDGIGNTIAPAFRERLQSAVATAQIGLPLNMDAWDGYPAARERLLEAAREADANLVVLAGDTHDAWAFDLDHAGEAAGVEFGGQSITSPGFERYVPLPPETLARAMVAGNPQLAFARIGARGYMAVELTPDRAQCEWRFSDVVKQRSARLTGTHRMLVQAGANRLET